MKFGNAAWGFRETELEKQIEITAKMGLGVLELGIENAPRDIRFGADTAHIRSLLKEGGVEALCAATGNDFTNGDTRDVDKVKRVIDMCEDLEVKYLRIFAGFSPKSAVTGARWDTMTECLNTLCDYSARVTLTVETHGGVNAHDDGAEHFESVTTAPDTLERLICDVPKIKLTFDAANLCAVGADYNALYEKLKSRIAVMHLKDFKRLKSGHLLPVACGEGATRFDKLLPFDGIALFEYEKTEDVADGLRRSYEYMKELMK